MADRYFVDSPVLADQAVLTGPEAHHLAHVMRAKLGDEVVLFDGSGAEFNARIEKIGRAEIELAVLSRSEIDRELDRRIVLGVALPKGERQRWLVEKVTELGVARIVPLVTQRGVAQPVDSALARLRRSVIEAAKQCGRNRLMEVAEPLDVGQFVRSSQAPLRLWGHPGGESFGDILARFGTVPDEAHAAIGPEGGFTDEETENAVRSGWQKLDLGRRILRVETAAIFVSCQLSVHCQ